MMTHFKATAIPVDRADARLRRGLGIVALTLLAIILLACGSDEPSRER